MSTPHPRPAAQADTAAAPRLRPGWEHEPAEPPIPWRTSFAVVLLTVLCSWLTGCGGNGTDEPACRPNFVGPPAPGYEDLPVCAEPPARRG